MLYLALSIRPRQEAWEESPYVGWDGRLSRALDGETRDRQHEKVWRKRGNKIKKKEKKERIVDWADRAIDRKEEEKKKKEGTIRLLIYVQEDPLPPGWEPDERHEP